jgi:5,10-methylenetetrahydromethanopterin reductase
VLPALAASAATTKAIRLGVGVFNPFSRHPTLIAMEMAALDELCDGRVVLGIGAGIKVAQMGLPAHRRIGAVRDAIHIVRRLLRGETVSYQGTMFSAHDVRLEFPLRRPGMPIFMAATGDRALHLCGELADGLMVSNLSPPEFTRHALETVARAASTTGRPTPAEIIQYVPCAIGEDGGEARERARATVGRMLTMFWKDGHASTAAPLARRAHDAADPEDFEGMMQRLALGEPAARVIDDAWLQRYAIAGTARECLEQFRVYGDAGVTEVAVWFEGARATEDITRLGRALASVRR